MGRRRGDPVVLIGAFRLTKAALLIALGAGGLLDLPERLATAAQNAVGWSGLYPARATVEHALGKLAALGPSKAHRLGLLSLGYAAVFLVEGLGLIRRRRWAEWLTVIVTSSFIPFEIYELVHRFGAAKVIALVLNVVIVAYLIWRRVQDSRGVSRVLRPRLA